MSRHFGPDAARLAGLTARLLGWRPDHFWQATPAELAAILAPLGSGTAPLGRQDLYRMMERENGGDGRQPDS